MTCAHLPLDVARCQPTGCRQSQQCARANDWPTGDHIALPIVDASVCLTTDRGSWCPMFIDLRGVALLSAKSNGFKALPKSSLEAA